MQAVVFCSTGFWTGFPWEQFVVLAVCGSCLSCPRHFSSIFLWHDASNADGLRRADERSCQSNCNMNRVGLDTMRLTWRAFQPSEWVLEFIGGVKPRDVREDDLEDDS